MFKCLQKQICDWKKTSAIDVETEDQEKTSAKELEDEDQEKTSAKKLTTTDQGKEFDFNSYATRKTVAQELMDLGLMASNASNLKSLIDQGPDQHNYFAAMIVMISLSIAVQVGVGILLLIIYTRKLKTDEEDKNQTRNKCTKKLNNISIGFITLIVVLNIFIAAFGIAST